MQKNPQNPSPSAESPGHHRNTAALRVADDRGQFRSHPGTPDAFPALGANPAAPRLAPWERGQNVGNYWIFEGIRGFHRIGILKGNQIKQQDISNQGRFSR